MFKVKRKRKRRRSWWRWWREKKTKRRNEQMNERYNKYTCSTVHTYVHRVETYREKQVWRRWMKIIINHCRCLNTHFFLNFFFFCRSFYSTQWCCFSSSFWLAHLEIQSKLFMNILFFAQEIFFSFSWIFFPFLLQNRFDSITHLNPSQHNSNTEYSRSFCLTSESGLLDPWKELTWLTRGWRAVFSRLSDENTSTHVYINSFLSTVAVILLHFTWVLGCLKMEWKLWYFSSANEKLLKTRNMCHFVFYSEEYSRQLKRIQISAINLLEWIFFMSFSGIIVLRDYVLVFFGIASFNWCFKMPLY